MYQIKVYIYAKIISCTRGYPKTNVLFACYKNIAYFFNKAIVNNKYL